MNRGWTWMRSVTPPKCTLSRGQKQEVVAEAEELLRTLHRPQFVLPPPRNPRFNDVTDFSVRWHGGFLLFTAKYACLGPHAVAPCCLINLTRIGWFRPERGNLWARRHNDRWFIFADDLTLEEGFATMRTHPWYHF